MEKKNLVCDNCNCEEIKIGKISGIASLKSIKAKTGIGGSEIKVHFCGKCGKIIEAFVDNPSAID